MQCFANGEFNLAHQPATHPYRVIEQNSVPIYDKDWGADEELLLLEGAEIYGLGSWADIADHIGGFRTKEEVQKHYEEIYLTSPNFPLPQRCNPKDMRLMTETSPSKFQGHKKRRIEDRKEKAKNAPPPVPKKKPTASVPSCHEVQGYMPGRLEFEVEHANDAEEGVQHMQFDPGEGINPLTGENEPEMDLKLTVMGIYNARLTQRAERKKVIFEHNLLDYRKNVNNEKKRTKEERDLLNKCKPFAREMNHDDFEEWCRGLIMELNLRQAISQLQDWRLNGIRDLESGSTYEAEKVARLQKAVPMGSLDRERHASARSKPAPIVETPSGAAALVAPELATKEEKSGQPNGITLAARTKAVILPLAGVTPLQFSKETTPDIHLLLDDEIDLCQKIRLQPKPYTVVKETILKEAVKVNGHLKKKQVKELIHLDGQKLSRVYDYMVSCGWIGKG